MPEINATQTGTLTLDDVTGSGTITLSAITEAEALLVLTAQT